MPFENDGLILSRPQRASDIAVDDLDRSRPQHVAVTFDALVTQGLHLALFTERAIVDVVLLGEYAEHLREAKIGGSTVGRRECVGNDQDFHVGDFANSSSSRIAWR